MFLSLILLIWILISKLENKISEIRLKRSKKWLTNQLRNIKCEIDIENLQVARLAHIWLYNRKISIWKTGNSLILFWYAKKGFTELSQICYPIKIISLQIVFCKCKYESRKHTHTHTRIRFSIVSPPISSLYVIQGFLLLRGIFIRLKRIIWILFTV